MTSIVYFRVLHSELELKISSWFSSQDEFSRVETRRVERHFFVTFENFVKRLIPTCFSCFFGIFLQCFAKISETCENKNFGKSRLSQGLSLFTWYGRKMYINPWMVESSTQLRNISHTEPKTFFSLFSFLPCFIHSGKAMKTISSFQLQNLIA